MEFLFVIIVLILSVVIHELAHGYAALAQGDPTAKYAGRLTLNPIKHLDLLGSFVVPVILFLLNVGVIVGWAKPVPYNPYNLRDQRWGESLVALAGPLSNIGIAFVFGLLIRFGGDTLSAEVMTFAGLIVMINIFLALFNLIPLPPLDGSKVLFAVLPQTPTFADMRLALERYGLFVVIAVVILAGGFIFPVIMTALAYLFYFFTGETALIQDVMTQFFTR